ncbi:MAG: 16S rRNA (guanine(527)-N(7))-methyltransferase RsmG [Desulfotignum sp.]|nr:16S rRNA (guanine(527)-N(7))-methyltransferase RsmG [Desulfobacteraceae bacterium]
MKQQDLDIFCETLYQGSKHLGIPLTQTEVNQMACHAEQLEKWNKKINLTAITDPGAMAQKHFLDAIAIQTFVHQKKTVLDMGSGGGFPGLPLKLLNPDMHMVLVDASRKKVHFLKHVIRTLGIGGIEVIHTRVEDLHRNPDVIARFDAVLARGFAALDILARLAGPLLQPKGTIYALKGPNAAEEISLDLKTQFAMQCDYYTLPFEGANRCLVRLEPNKKSS